MNDKDRKCRQVSYLKEKTSKLDHCQQHHNDGESRQPKSQKENEIQAPGRFCLPQEGGASFHMKQTQELTRGWKQEGIHVPAFSVVPYT